MKDETRLGLPNTAISEDRPWHELFHLVRSNFVDRKQFSAIFFLRLNFSPISDDLMRLRNSWPAKKRRSQKKCSNSGGIAIDRDD